MKGVLILKKTKQNYEAWLNELGVPDDDKKTLGGRIPDYAKYGSWLRRNDPIAFEVGYNDWKKEMETYEYRVCSECQSKMVSGYVIEGGMEHYCSDHCLEKNMTRAEFLDLYNDGEGDSYWTEF